MVKKRYDSLINQQARFLELMMEGRLTAGEVMKELHLAPYTLRRWMRRAKFAREWESAIAFIGKAHRSDVAAGRGGDEKPGGVTGGASQAGADGVRAAAAGEEGVLSEGPGVLSTADDLDSSIKPLSERERIRTLHGREAAEAFDRLVQLRLKNQVAAAARAAATEVDPPDGNASVATTDDSPPSPAPAETSVVVPTGDVESCAIA